MSFTSNLSPQQAALPTARGNGQIEKHEFTILPLGLTLIVFEGAENRLLWKYRDQIYLEEDICGLLLSDVIVSTGQTRHTVTCVKSCEFRECLREALKNHRNIAEL